ncbi:hypothetical protein KA005_51055 [bacterium]|nr:hypothetical protein [bacterium]
MERWKQDLLKELDSLDPQEISSRMTHLKYGDPTSPRYEIVKQWLERQPQKPKAKSWHEKAWGKVVIGVIIGLILSAISIFIFPYITKKQQMNLKNNQQEILEKGKRP